MIERAWRWLIDWIVSSASRVWKLGADDPRRVVHGAKVGAALTLVSLFYYMRPLYDGLGGATMWAVMTVVVVFEYTVGGCLYKGFNRATATLSASALAVGIHWLANQSGDKMEPFILSASVFLLAAAATFSRFIPTVKANFDYGVTIFILTFSLVAMSGYRVDELLALAQQRVLTVIVGIFICLSVSVVICPVWAGAELHRQIVRNMEKLADSLECCVEEYFSSGVVDQKSASSHESQGYKCVLNSKASEDSQANLARWEPAHGRFGFKHPWSQYQKIGGAMRHCACSVEALNSCINSEVKAPDPTKKLLRDACMRLSSQSSMVLKEMSRSIKEMTKSRSIDLLIEEMDNAVYELQSALQSLPSNLTPQMIAAEAETEDNKLKFSVIEALPLITVATLLIDISARIEGVVDTFNTLVSLASFKPFKDDKSKQNRSSNNPPSHMSCEQETTKTLQEV
ncbi:aluminum-activated malate transporter 10-like [Ananas comosus]|uniref:Aluminum-activated malate transporter 10-like n=1 Tax=Ananas comosus TaxID=4615 RepID=A0A6P5FFA3_ANACO|nr:aluminum-activated malate transporter 10-like [Ananas comosus]